MVLAYAYSGSLISFFSVEVHPKPPKTFDDIANMVEEKDLNVHICCIHIEAAMRDSTLESFKTMMQLDRVQYHIIIFLTNGSSLLNVL